MNPRQKFLERSLSVGLECKTITPVDVTKHCSPDILAKSLPAELKAKLLTACLSASKMDPQLILDVIGTEALAENVPMGILWDCIAEAAGRVLGDSAQGGTSARDDVGGKKTTTSKKTTAKAGAKSNKASAKQSGRSDTKASANAKSSGTGKGAAKAKSLAAGTNRALIPASEFDIDTDVGEDVGDEDVAWDDDIVEVVEEDVIGASTSVLDEIASEGGVSDWSRDEETFTRDVTKRR